MNKIERILMAATGFYLVIMCLVGFSENAIAKKRLNAVEIRLQNHEHLLSLALSESRSPAIVGPTNGVSASTNEKRQGNHFTFQRCPKCQSGHYPPKNDGRPKGK